LVSRWRNPFNDARHGGDKDAAEFGEPRASELLSGFSLLIADNKMGVRVGVMTAEELFML
jgi:hypothetical protein